MMRPKIEDFVGILNRDLSGYDLIVFTGVSGSGKSSLIHLCQESVPELKDALVIDEITRLKDLYHYRRLFNSRKQILVASHLPRWIWRILPVAGRRLYISTDDCMTKIRRYIESRGITVSHTTLNTFFKTYRAAYTEVDIILENYKGRSFDEAYAQFHRNRTIRRQPERGF